MNKQDNNNQQNSGNQNIQQNNNNNNNQQNNNNQNIQNINNQQPSQLQPGQDTNIPQNNDNNNSQTVINNNPQNTEQNNPGLNESDDRMFDFGYLDDDITTENINNVNKKTNIKSMSNNNDSMSIQQNQVKTASKDAKKNQPQQNQNIPKNNNNNNVPETITDEEKKKLKDETEKILALQEKEMQKLNTKQLSNYLTTLSMAIIMLTEYKDDKDIKNKMTTITDICNNKIKAEAEKMTVISNNKKNNKTDGQQKNTEIIVATGKKNKKTEKQPIINNNQGNKGNNNNESAIIGFADINSLSFLDAGDEILTDGLPISNSYIGENNLFDSDDIEDVQNLATMNDNLTRGLNDKMNKSFDLTNKKENNLKKNSKQNQIKNKQTKKNENLNNKNVEQNNIPQDQNIPKNNNQPDQNTVQPNNVINKNEQKLNIENNNENKNIDPVIKTNDNSNVVKHGAVAEYKTTENNTKKKENTNTDKNVNKEKTSKKIDDKKSNTNTSNKEKLTESKNDKSLSTDIDNNEIEEDEQNYKKIKPTALKEFSKFNKTVKNKSTTNKKKKTYQRTKKTSKKNIFYTPKEAIHKGDNVVIDTSKQTLNQNQNIPQDNLPTIKNNNVKKKTHPSTLSHKNNNTPQQSTGSKILKAIEIVIFPIFLIHKLIDFLFPNDDKKVEQKTNQTMPGFDATAKNTAQKETPTQQQNNQQLINLQNMQNNQKQQL